MMGTFDDVLYAIRMPPNHVQTQILHVIQQPECSTVLYVHCVSGLSKQQIKGEQITLPGGIVYDQLFNLFSDCKFVICIKISPS